MIALRLVGGYRSVKLCASTREMQEMGGLGRGREVPSIVHTYIHRTGTKPPRRDTSTAELETGTRSVI